MQIKKQYLRQAVDNIVRDKFGDHWRAVMAERRYAADRIYELHFGRVASMLEVAIGDAGDDWQRWCRPVSNLLIDGAEPCPDLWLRNPKKPSGSLVGLFSGRHQLSTRGLPMTQTRPFPVTLNRVDREHLCREARKLLDEQDRLAGQFSRSVEGFYTELCDTVFALNTDKRIDEYWPELWQHMPQEARVRPQNRGNLVPTDRIASLRARVES